MGKISYAKNYQLISSRWKFWSKNSKITIFESKRVDDNFDKINTWRQ